MSCLTVNIGDATKHIKSVGIADNTPTVSTSFNAINSKGRLSFYANVGTANIVKPIVKADISMQIVCGIDKSLMVLCSADGELITIDGKYLIVKIG